MSSSEYFVLPPRPGNSQSPSRPSFCYVDEPELDDSTEELDFDEDQFSASEVEADSNTGKVSKREIAEVCNELRRLRINPQPCLGVVKKHWANVQGAIARVKDA
ncbi:hypothetical protein [Dendronalium sp. ChiSLP03b]|uniref:hypothetical protein n=1 Tax=Dendronalium sp. ChiSLP03b TaxID=3075381 RepID=UPI002AD279C1|nr:hypothetical protein [Dendronalium sp. ChiSLP03b]MDZ8207867.1 hypothetical protein [Dendronalium sp. ChiSLP03b]